MYLSNFKPLFDFFSALFFLLLVSPVLLVITIYQSLYYFGNPFFLQKRIGRNGNSFTIYKFKTIDSKNEISTFSALLRKYKLDELPQLFNVIKGEMSVVGPRPDLPGYYDLLEGENRNILKLKPGLTGYASIVFYNEEYLLNQVEDPIQYNDEIIFPKKIKLNLWYFNHISFMLDLKIIFKTLILPFKKN